MKRLLKITIPLLFLLVIVAFVLSMGKDISQPINYNHKKHIEEAGLSCIDCHQYVEEASVAGLPNKEVCMGCHEEALTENPEEAKLIEIANSDNQLIWERVYKMPPDVYFSHRRHVGFAKIECEKCHGKMEEMTAPPKKPTVNLSMENCMDCHEKTKADNDCLACHL